MTPVPLSYMKGKDIIHCNLYILGQASHRVKSGTHLSTMFQVFKICLVSIPPRPLPFEKAFITILSFQFEEVPSYDARSISLVCSARWTYIRRRCSSKFPFCPREVDSLLEGLSPLSFGSLFLSTCFVIVSLSL